MKAFAFMVGLAIGVLSVLAGIMLIALPLWGCLVLAGANIGYWNTVGIVGAIAVLSSFVRGMLFDK